MIKNKIHKRIKSRLSELELIQQNLELIPIYARSNLDISRLYNYQRQLIQDNRSDKMRLEEKENENKV